MLSSMGNLIFSQSKKDLIGYEVHYFVFAVNRHKGDGSKTENKKREATEAASLSCNA